jgi:hypothetical protein
VFSPMPIIPYTQKEQVTCLEMPPQCPWPPIEIRALLAAPRGQWAGGLAVG